MKELSRITIVLVAWMLFIGGIIITPLPLPVGQIMALVGLAVLATESRLIRQFCRGLRRRFPRLHIALSDHQHSLPSYLGRAVAMTDPAARD